MKWHSRLFGISIFTCIGFLFLTVSAMAIYSGGTIQNHSQAHYRFFQQPFSDLGRTHLFDGRPNTISMSLFMAAMFGAGVGLACFFIAFAVEVGRTKLTRFFSFAGGILGIVAAICFIGVACTPWDLYMKLHINFVLCAFRSLLVATVLDLIAVIIEGRLRRRLVIPFIAFICILFGYIILLTAGLSGRPADDPVLQATGQKIVVYSAILMVVIQSIQMRRHTPVAF